MRKLFQKIIPFSLSYQMGSTLTGKNLLSREKFLPFKIGPFSKGLCIQDKQQEVTKKSSISFIISENQSTQRKATWPSISWACPSHLCPKRGSNSQQWPFLLIQYNQYFWKVHQLTKISIPSISILKVCICDWYFNTRFWFELWNHHLVDHLFDCISVPNLLQTIDLCFQVGSSWYKI